MELFNDSLGRYTNGRYKKLGPALDNDIRKLTELALCVIIAVL